MPEPLDEAMEDRLLTAMGRFYGGRCPGGGEHIPGGGRREDCEECLLYLLRAAIRADREVRGNLYAPAEKLCCEAVGCPSCDAVLRVTVLTATTDGGIGAISETVEAGKLPDEIAHADRLVGALKHAEEWLAEEGCDCGVMPDPPCALCEARAVLREHEERRR